MQDPTNSKGYSAGHVVLAALGGAIAGAGVALLLAPKSGRETRQQLAGYYGAAKEKISRVPQAVKSAGHAVKEVMTSESDTAK